MAVSCMCVYSHNTGKCGNYIPERFRMQAFYTQNKLPSFSFSLPLFLSPYLSRSFSLAITHTHTQSNRHTSCVHAVIVKCDPTNSKQQLLATFGAVEPSLWFGKCSSLPIKQTQTKFWSYLFEYARLHVNIIISHILSKIQSLHSTLLFGILTRLQYKHVLHV